MREDFFCETRRVEFPFFAIRPLQMILVLSKLLNLSKYSLAVVHWSLLSKLLVSY